MEPFPAVSGLWHRHICHPDYPKATSAGYIKLFIKAVPKLKIQCISPNKKAFKATDSRAALRLPLIKAERNLENGESEQETETERNFKKKKKVNCRKNQ